jgi:hypothetical protein
MEGQFKSSPLLRALRLRQRLAGGLRMQYPPAIKIVQLPCTGRIDVLSVLLAMEGGAFMRWSRRLPGDRITEGTLTLAACTLQERRDRDGAGRVRMFNVGGGGPVRRRAT